MVFYRVLNMGAVVYEQSSWEQSSWEPETLPTFESARLPDYLTDHPQTSLKMPSSRLLVQKADNSAATATPKEPLSTSAANINKPGASREPSSTMTKEFTFSFTKSPLPAKVGSSTSYDKMVAVAGQASMGTEHHSMFAAAFKQSKVAVESEGVVEAPSEKEAIPASKAGHGPAAPSKKVPEISKGLNAGRKASVLDRQT